MGGRGSSGLGLVLGVHGAGLVFLPNAAILLPRQPDLVSERGQPATGAKRWGVVLAPMLFVAGPLAAILVSGLDLRAGWSGHVWLGVRLAALLLLLAGYTLGAGQWRPTASFPDMCAYRANAGIPWPPAIHTAACDIRDTPA